MTLIKSLQLQPFCVTLTLTFSVQGHLMILVNLCVKFAFIYINDYRHYTLHVYRPWSDFFIATFCVTLTLTSSVQGHLNFYM